MIPEATWRHAALLRESGVADAQEVLRQPAQLDVRLTQVLSLLPWRQEKRAARLHTRRQLPGEGQHSLTPTSSDSRRDAATATRSLPWAIPQLCDLPEACEREAGGCTKTDRLLSARRGPQADPPRGAGRRSSSVLDLESRPGISLSGRVNSWPIASRASVAKATLCLWLASREACGSHSQSAWRAGDVIAWSAASGRNMGRPAEPLMRLQELARSRRCLAHRMSSSLHTRPMALGRSEQTPSEEPA